MYALRSFGTFTYRIFVCETTPPPRPARRLDMRKIDADPASKPANRNENEKRIRTAHVTEKGKATAVVVSNVEYSSVRY